MENYIYLNFSDLSEKTQEELQNMAYNEVASETTQQEANDLRMDLEDLVSERINRKLLSWSMKGLFVFNI